MSEIKLNKGEPVERALRELKKKKDREGTMQEIRNRRYYEKPSVEKYRRNKRAKWAARMEAKWNKENL